MPCATWNPDPRPVTMESAQTQANEQVRIVCGNQSWRVDRATLCKESLVISKSLSMGMQESFSGTIRHNESDPAAVGRMVSWLKNKEYVVEPEKDLTLFDDSDETEGESTVPHVHGDILRSHFEVYLLADYYDMPSLREYVVMRLEAAAELGWQPIGFVDLIARVYRMRKSETQDLRGVLCRYAATFRADIVKSEQVMADLAQEGDGELQRFLADLFVAAVRQEVSNASLERQRTAHHHASPDANASARERTDKLYRVEKQTTSNLLKAIPRLPRKCWNEVCEADFPFHLDFRREPSRNADLEILPRDWTIHCAKCGTIVHKVKGRMPYQML